MAIIIEQRTRATVSDPWSAWSNLPVDAVTDGTFTNTNVLEYRIASTDLLIADITDGDIINSEWVGNGIFDKLMDAFNKNIQIQFESNRIDANQYATIYLGGTQTIIQQAIMYSLQERVVEKDIELRNEQITTEQTNQRKLEAEITATKANMLQNAAKVVEEAVAQYGYESASFDTTTGVITLGTRSDTEGVINKQEARLDEEIDLLQTQDIAANAEAYNAAIKAKEDAIVQYGYAGTTVDATTYRINLNESTTPRTPSTALLDRTTKVQEDQVTLSKFPSGRK